MKKIYEYLEYRDYLQEHFEECKQSNSFFSYRYIQIKTGIDASYYVKVLHKQKHLGERGLEAVMQLLKLSEREREYFRALVRFNKARQPDVAKHYFEQLLSLRESRIRTLDKSTYDYFSAWYNIPLRELLNVYTFKDDYAALARRLNPPITVREAKTAIALLRRLGLIRRHDDGSWRPAEALLSTGEQWQGTAIANFQREIMRLGIESIDRLPRKRRDMSTLTVSTSQECLEIIRERLAQVRKEILELVRAEEKVDGVYQFNFQCFPLSNPDAGDEAT